MSYRDWEEDPRNRRGRHSAADGWLASDETQAGPARRRAGRARAPYPGDASTGTDDLGARNAPAESRRSTDPYSDTRGWTRPDRLEDTGAWTRGTHTGEWQQPDEGWPARPEPDSAPPGGYLPGTWAERPERSWTDQPGRGATPYADRPWSSGAGDERADTGYDQGDSYEPGSYRPPAYGRPELPSAHTRPMSAPAGAYTGEVLPRGYHDDAPAERTYDPPIAPPYEPPRARPYLDRPAHERPAARRTEPDPVDPYAGSSYSSSGYAEPSHDAGRRHRPQPPTYREDAVHHSATQEALPAYSPPPSYLDQPGRRALPARREPAGYRELPVHDDEPAYDDQPVRDDRPSYRQRPSHEGYRAEPTYRGEPPAYRGEPPAYRDQPPSYREAAAPRGEPAYREGPPSYRDAPPSYRELPAPYDEEPPAPARPAAYRQQAITAPRRERPPTYRDAIGDLEEPSYRGGSGDYGYAERATAGYPEPARRRPVAALPPAQRRVPVYDVDDDDEAIEDEPIPGGYLASMAYTAIWYAVPMVLWVLWSLTLNSEASANCIDDAGVPCESERVEALSTLLQNLPRMGATLVLSVLIAVALRWVSSSWKAATVGFAAAVVGGGMATVAVSVITGQPIG